MSLPATHPSVPLYWGVPVSRVEAWHYARLCRADQRDDVEFAQYDHWERKTIDTDDVRLLFAPQNKLVIIFRGTETWREWRRNLTFMPAQWSDIARVHRGFARNVEALMQWMVESVAFRQYLHNGHREKLVITGFSRGGALATLAAAYLHLKVGTSPDQVVTFGAPKVGGLRWVELYGSLRIPTIRVVNQWDMIRLLPPFHWFRHTHLKVTAKRSPYNPLAARHDLNQYIEGLE